MIKDDELIGIISIFENVGGGGGTTGAGGFLTGTPADNPHCGEPLTVAR